MLTMDFIRRLSHRASDEESYALSLRDQIRNEERTYCGKTEVPKGGEQFVGPMDVGDPRCWNGGSAPES